MRLTGNIESFLAVRGTLWEVGLCLYKCWGLTSQLSIVSYGTHTWIISGNACWKYWWGKFWNGTSWAFKRHNIDDIFVSAPKKSLITTRCRSRRTQDRGSFHLISNICKTSAFESKVKPVPTLAFCISMASALVQWQNKIMLQNNVLVLHPVKMLHCIGYIERYLLFWLSVWLWNATRVHRVFSMSHQATAAATVINEPHRKVSKVNKCKIQWQTKRQRQIQRHRHSSIICD